MNEDKNHKTEESDDSGEEEEDSPAPILSLKLR